MAGIFSAVPLVRLTSEGPGIPRFRDVGGIIATFATRHDRSRLQRMDQDFLWVKTNSLYVVICDEGSLANRPGFMDTEWEAAGVAARQARQKGYWQLFHFNDRLMWLVEQGELLAWTLLFDGVFRATVEAAPVWMPSSPLPSPCANLGQEMLRGRLLCPTGRLLVSCMKDLGARPNHVIEVEPGACEVAVQRDEDQEFEHSHIESVDVYPVGDGPDWRIGIRPLL